MGSLEIKSLLKDKKPLRHALMAKKCNRNDEKPSRLLKAVRFWWKILQMILQIKDDSHLLLYLFA